MNLIPFVVPLAYRLGRSIFGGKSLSWTEVNEWIMRYANRNRYGRGYTDSRHPPQTALNGFVELRKEQTGKDAVRVIASVYFDPQPLRPTTSKAWVAKKLDKTLEQQFGNNM